MSLGCSSNSAHAALRRKDRIARDGLVAHEMGIEVRSHGVGERAEFLSLVHAARP